MNKLQKQMRKREKSLNQQTISKRSGLTFHSTLSQKTIDIRKGDKSRTIPIPSYDRRGKVIQPLKRARRKKAIIAILISGGVFSFVYGPSFIPEKNEQLDSNITVETDYEAIRNSNSILRNNAQEDFDGDGILNTDETQAGTDPWRIDTDGDEVTDYAELHITNTSPTEYSEILKDMQIKLDKSEEKSLAYPYSIGNVILWPDTYESKAYGSVVETSDGGYRFCGFSGNVLFTEDKEKYAYKVENGIHSLLNQDQSDSTWTVNTGDKVELFDQQLSELTNIEFFGHGFNIKDGILSKILAFILPDKGFITAARITEQDVQPETPKSITNTIMKPIFKENDFSRLMSNMTTISSLGAVRTALDDGKCVAVSLYNSEQGEYLGIIYGYSGEDRLFLTDMETQEQKYILHVTEKAEKMLNEEGEIVSVLYYDWSALGFSSDANDRISFFAYSNTANERGGEE